MAEQMLAGHCDAYGLRAVALRYFNAAGADADSEIGEAHEPETHLIPNIIKSALDDASGPFKIFGNDYPTPDGTCIRDFVHVADLCEAHLLALEYVDRNEGFTAFNLGTGTGNSVAEVLTACRAICAGRPESTLQPRRDGDPAMLVASNAAAGHLLGWRPRRTLANCVESARAWHHRQL